MSLTSNSVSTRVVVERADFQTLFDVLTRRGYQILGPTRQNDAIGYGRLSSVEDLPIGWIDRQNGGSYHLARHKKKTLFAYVIGADSWKKFLYPVEKLMFEAERDGKKIEVHEVPDTPPKQAFVGVRSCELAAMSIQDRVFLQGPYVDPAYRRRRKDVFIVAVNCTRAGGTCFCVSMKTGPEATVGFDLAVTEVFEGERHYFVVTSGSDAGADVLGDIPRRDASAGEVDAAAGAIQHAVSRMGRHLDTDGLPELLDRNFENEQWEKIGARCLTCGNCTMVCPTCFCSAIEDRTDLTGRLIQRRRRWDSCHSVEFSYIHGGSIRASGMSRYRQWMMHKLAYWPEQFGTYGCVGCGRCITWCPVGIDLTEEARGIRKTE